MKALQSSVIPEAREQRKQNYIKTRINKEHFGLESPCHKFYKTAVTSFNHVGRENLASEISNDMLPTSEDGATAALGVARGVPAQCTKLRFFQEASSTGITSETFPQGHKI